MISINSEDETPPSQEQLPAMSDTNIGKMKTMTSGNCKEVPRNSIDIMVKAELVKSKRLTKVVDTIWVINHAVSPLCSPASPVETCLPSKIGNIDSPRNRCQLCFKHVQHYNNQKRHAVLHLGMKPYKCPLCEERFIRRNGGEIHVKERHPEQSLQPFHDLTAVEKEDIKRKLKECFPNGYQTTSESLHVSCQVCSKSVRRQLSELQNHVLAHFGVKRWKCPSCENRYANPRNVQNHVGRQHPNTTARAPIYTFSEQDERNLELQLEVYFPIMADWRKNTKK